LLVPGTTATASIDGISAAGADPSKLAQTPAADAELLSYGDVVRAPAVPQSPTGCLTPAVVTRAIRELLGFELVVVDGGLETGTGAPTVTVGAQPGADIRESEPVPTAHGAWEAARQFTEALPAAEVVIGESIPGGTTTAMGVLAGLGERRAVSSSLPENPIETKESVVSSALDASDVTPGGLAEQPKRAVRFLGDPVLPVVAGATVGALESDTAVTLGGGTQMLAAAALVRNAGVEAPLEVATTRYVAEDESAAVQELAADLDVSLSVADPGFDQADHPAMRAYLRGEAKEGVGMGGALAMAERAGLSGERIRNQIATVAERVGDQ
jgi:uncharacterized protein (TIGR00303 family)